jgi:hypothetical protein
MSDCAICDDARVQAIDAALDQKRFPAVVVRQFRLEPRSLQWHVAHRAQEEVTRRSLDASHHLQGQALPDQDMLVTENPLSQFKQAWQLAKDDDRMRASMLAWLNDQLRHDDIGL